MNQLRFSSIKHPYLKKFKKIRLSFLLYFLIITIFIIWILHIDRMNVDKQYESLNLALQHDIVHCYAVEGTYPPSLEYMVEHYGLTYDKSLFYIDYCPIGSNIYPEYEILILK